VALFTALVAAQSALAGPDKLLLAGNDQGLWLVRTIPNDQDSRQGTFDVVAMTPGGKWQWVAGDLRGSAKVAAASQRWLHVIQDKPGYLIFELPKSATASNSGQSPSVGPTTDDPHWPADATPVAACSADSFYTPAATTQESTTQPCAPGAAQLAPPPWPSSTTSSAPAPAPYQTILVIVEHAGPPTTQPAAMPAGRSAFLAQAPETPWPYYEAPGTRPARTVTSLPNPPVAHSIFVNLGDRWQYIADIQYPPDLPPVAHGQKMQCAVFHGQLYVMLTPQRGDPMMLAWDKQTWRNVTLPAGLDQVVAIAMVEISDKLVAVLSGPSTTTQPAHASQNMVRLLISSPAGDFDLPPQPLTLAGRPMPPIDTLPLASRLGSRIAILWAHDTTFNFGTCGLDCVIPSIETVDVLAVAQHRQDGQQLMNWFTGAILVVIFIPLILFRPKAPPQLFSLPQGVLPGNLVKRALAAAIDFGPFAVASYIVFSVRIEDFALLWQPDGNPPLNVVYAYIAMFSTYISYCAIMEASCGATLGKLIFGLKVVCDMGVKITIREAIIRNAIKAIELPPPFMPLLLVMFLNHNRRRFGDLVARTAVVEAKSLPSKDAQTDEAAAGQQDATANEPEDAGKKTQ
jgi:uncharacterized RDD family membrane protein YckC